MLGEIYCITNKTNGKKYVGKTSSTKDERWVRHLMDKTKTNYKKLPLYRAIAKYGSDNFTIELLEKVNIEYIDEREKYWIEKLDTYKNGYNASLGGEGYQKVTESDEAFIILEYLRTQNTNHVSRECGFSVPTVMRYLKKNNVKTITKKEYNQIRPTNVKVYVKQTGIEYFNMRECAKEISSLLGCDYESFYNKIKYRFKQNEEFHLEGYDFKKTKTKEVD